MTAQAAGTDAANRAAQRSDTADIDDLNGTLQPPQNAATCPHQWLFHAEQDSSISSTSGGSSAAPSEAAHEKRTKTRCA